MFRLIALDLDGTLHDSRDRVSEANARAVQRARDQGVVVVLCTSRWYAIARGTAEALGLRAPLICHNGALVRRPDGSLDLVRLPLDLPVAREVAAFIDRQASTAVLTVGETTYLRPRHAAEPSTAPPGVVLVPRLSEVVAEPALGFLVFGREASDELEAAFGQSHSNLINLDRGYSDTFPHYVNIVHAQADKGSALLTVCRHLGIDPAQTLAIGDAGPDVSMFRVAGHSVAMGNAPDHVKAAADMVAPTNDEDGVAWAIEKFVL